MIDVTFAIYPWFPIACEGDDPWTESTTVAIKNLSELESARAEMERIRGGYIQVWSVEQRS